MSLGFEIVGCSTGETVACSKILVGGGAWQSAHPCNKVTLDIALHGKAFVDGISFDNRGACSIEVYAGTDFTSLVTVIARLETNGMLRHKSEISRDTHFDLVLSIPPEPSRVLRIVLRQPYEPQICIGLARLQIQGSAAVASRPVMSAAELLRAAVPPLGAPRLVFLPAPDKARRPGSGVPTGAQVAGTSGPPLKVPILEDEAEGSSSGAPMSLHEVRQVLRAHNTLSERSTASPVTHVKEASPDRFKGPAPLPPKTHVLPVAAPPVPVPVQKLVAQPQIPEKASVPLNKILSGVAFDLSGFVNPQRSQLREMAVAMGAVFNPGSPTHLICAFDNTPKAQSLGDRVRVVRKDWVEQCHLQRRRLPEERFGFAVDVSDDDSPSAKRARTDE
eukprot:TRINITY_DN2236_c0_g1_i5.p1 TRINITY_DN2236_c0_g1~~TRINITY_DN2236_c0_g1_i5.p1  ORF type:complete len:390 (-),score=42.35 TRINITY_DN2236_c0_g1_i5:8-1177(-)